MCEIQLVLMSITRASKARQKIFGALFSGHIIRSGTDYIQKPSVTRTDEMCGPSVIALTTKSAL
jgi:hypothetical protein